MPSKKRLSYIPYFIIIFAILLNVIARFSLSFCEFHLFNIFPLITTPYAWFMSLFPFSVGELMLYAAAILLITLFIGGFICLFRARSKFIRFYRAYAKVCLWLAAIFFLIMTLNCFILFHCAPFTSYYPIGGKVAQGREYGLREIAVLRDYIVENANRLAEELERNEKGYLIYEGDMIKQAQYEMRRLGLEFGRLAGYYPRPKPLLLSNFFSQQFMMGYFFPFSMEANYNASMYIVNKPMTMCHELAHVKGFMFEDEASFIAFLAGAGSEDDFFRYSAYMSVLSFVERDFLNLLGNDPVTYREHVKISDLVRRDDIFLTAEAWELVERNAIFSTDLVREISNEIVEVNLTINGVSDGRQSYGRVVRLLLMYYDGILY